MNRPLSLARSPFVYCLLGIAIVGCGRVDPVLTPRLNTAAALPSGLPFDPTKWRVITSSVDNRAGTMSTEFGDDLAVSSFRSTSPQKQPLLGTIALVTWRQQDDMRWFGGKIPSKPVSVELVRLQPTGVDNLFSEYHLYKGEPLNLVIVTNPEDVNRRVRSILADPVAIFP